MAITGVYWQYFTSHTHVWQIFINNLSKYSRRSAFTRFVLSFQCGWVFGCTNLVSFLSVVVSCRLFMMTQKFYFDPDYYVTFYINNEIPCGWIFTSFIHKTCTQITISKSFFWLQPFVYNEFSNDDLHDLKKVCVCVFHFEWKDE